MNNCNDLVSWRVLFDLRGLKVLQFVWHKFCFIFQTNSLRFAQRVRCLKTFPFRKKKQDCVNANTRCDIGNQIDVVILYLLKWHIFEKLVQFQWFCTSTLGSPRMPTRALEFGVQMSLFRTNLNIKDDFGVLS